MLVIIYKLILSCNFFNYKEKKIQNEYKPNILKAINYLNSWYNIFSSKKLYKKYFFRNGRFFLFLLVLLFYNNMLNLSIL